MKVFCSKYGLTRGVLEINGEIVKSRETLHLYFSAAGMFLRDSQWHRTREEADAKVREMAEKKIKSLRRQIARLEGLLHV